MLRCEGPGVEDVVQDCLVVQVESVGDGPQPVRPEGVLGVDVDDLPRERETLFDRRRK